MMSISEILAAMSAAKKVVTAIEALFGSLKPAFLTEAEDVKAAAVSVEKAFVDLKGGFEALEAAIKAAFNAPS